MQKTIKDIATEFGITKVSVFNKIKSIKNFRRKYVTKQRNRLIINSKGYKILANYYNKNHKDTIHNTNNQLLITNLLKENKNLTKSNQNLENLLNQQQQLQLSSQQEVKRLRSHIKKINGPVHRHGFFWRLFH